MTNQNDRVRSALIVAATGLGKTVMLAGIASRWPIGRIMLISHRFEINDQACKTFANYCGEPVDLEQAQFHANTRHNKTRIVVASVQTLNARRRGRYRMERFDPDEFGLLLVDEAHRATSVTYRRVFEHFEKNPNSFRLGCTATPDRLDGVGLGTVFEKVVSDLNIRWAIENGWLVPVKQSFVEIKGLDLSRVRTVGGDLDNKQLAKLVEVERTCHEMAVPIADMLGDSKRGIVFTASVAQARLLANILKRHNIRAECVTGETERGTRRRIISDYKNFEVQALVNCGVFTEGFDAPTDLIACGRPTKSRSLYCQMIGRGLRPLPGSVDGEHMTTVARRRESIACSEKPYCHVLDFVGNSGQHSLVASGDILAGSDPPEVVERAKKIQKEGFDGDTLRALDKARQQLEAEEEARKKKLTVGVEYELADKATLYSLADVPQLRVPGYLKGKPASEKQRAFLVKLGYTNAQIDQLNPRSASAAIDYAIRNPKTATARWINKKKIQEGTL